MKSCYFVIFFFLATKCAYTLNFLLWMLMPTVDHFRCLLMYPQGLENVTDHLSVFLCVVNHDELIPGWWTVLYMHILLSRWVLQYYTTLYFWSPTSSSISGWNHFAQFTVSIVNKDITKSKYSGEFSSFFVRHIIRTHKTLQLLAIDMWNFEWMVLWFQIHCISFGKRNTTGDGKSLSSCHDYPMVFLSMISLQSELKFK